MANENELKLCLSMTDYEARTFIGVVTERAELRNKSGAMKSEIDFVVGAMVALFAAGKEKLIPAGWIFNPMSGKSPITNEMTDYRKAEDAKLYLDDVESSLEVAIEVLNEMQEQAQELRNLWMK